MIIRSRDVMQAAGLAIFLFAVPACAQSAKEAISLERENGLALTENAPQFNGPKGSLPFPKVNLEKDIQRCIDSNRREHERDTPASHSLAPFWTDEDCAEYAAVKLENVQTLWGWSSQTRQSRCAAELHAKAIKSFNPDFLEYYSEGENPQTERERLEQCLIRPFGCYQGGCVNGKSSQEAMNEERNPSETNAIKCTDHRVTDAYLTVLSGQPVSPRALDKEIDILATKYIERTLQSSNGKPVSIQADALKTQLASVLGSAHWNRRLKSVEEGDNVPGLLRFCAVALIATTKIGRQPIEIEVEYSAFFALKPLVINKIYQLVDVGGWPFLGQSIYISSEEHTKELSKESQTEASQDFAESIPLLPQEAVQRAVAYQNAGDFDHAIAYFTRALGLGSDTSIYAKRGDAFIHRGEARKNKEDYNDAIDDFTQAINLNPNNGEFYVNRGNAYYNRGISYNAKNDYDLAIDDFSKAISAGRLVQYNRGITYNAKGDYDRAIYDFSFAIGHNFAVTPSYAGRASAYFSRGLFDKANTDYATLAAMTENEDLAKNSFAGTETAKALGAYSWSALFVRDFGGALAASKRALNLAPNEVWIGVNRAHALMFLGRKEEALAAYLEHRGERLPTLGNKSWEEAVSDDFAELDKRGFSHPQMSEIRIKLGLTAK